MATKLGRNARLRIDGTTVARMTSMSISYGREVIDITSFGDVLAKFRSGMGNWKGSFAGHLDVDDANQQLLVQSAEEGTELQNVEWWMDATSYYTMDIAEDPEAACFIDTYEWTTDNNSVVSFTMSVTGSGPLTLKYGTPSD